MLRIRKLQLLLLLMQAPLGNPGRIWAGPMPSAVTVTVEQVLKGTYDGELLGIEDQLLDQLRDDADQVSILQAGQWIFNGCVEKSTAGQKLSSLPWGSRVQLAGICSSRWMKTRYPGLFRFFSRLPEDTLGLERPSWWIAKHTLAALGLMAVAILAVLRWLVVLRRRVRKQTDKIRRQLELEAALEQRYGDLFEKASDLVYTHGLAGNFTSLNRAGERITGYSHDEILQMNIAQIVVPEHQERLSQWIGGVIAGQSPHALELEIVARHGQRVTLEVSLRLIWPRTMQSIRHWPCACWRSKAIGWWWPATGARPWPRWNESASTWC